MSTAVPMYGFGGGGGAALNFKVVGNPQPVSPSENTIWLNTDVPIASWHFQAEQPKNMAHGDVWFSVGTSSTVEFNALKKNGIQVYPLFAKQYVNGAWVGKETKSYQNDEWVDWFTGTLFDNGNDFESVSGGWYCTNDGNKLVVDIPKGVAAKTYHIYTNKKPINLANYKTVSVTVVGGSQNTSVMCIGIFASPGNGSNITPVVQIQADTFTNGVHTIDVSTLKDGYYIGFGLYRNQNVATSSATDMQIGTVKFE